MPLHSKKHPLMLNSKHKETHEALIALSKSSHLHPTALKMHPETQNLILKTAILLPPF